MSELEPQLEPDNRPTLSLPMLGKPLYRAAGVFGFVAFVALLQLLFELVRRPPMIRLTDNLLSNVNIIMPWLIYGSVLGVLIVLTPGIYHFLTRQPIRLRHMVLYTLVLVPSIFLAMISVGLGAGDVPSCSSGFLGDIACSLRMLAPNAALYHIPLVPICLILGWGAFLDNKRSFAPFFMALPFLNIAFVAFVQ